MTELKKEAEEYTKENLCKECHNHCREGMCTCTECKKKTFKDGAEFGYNKAKAEVEESYRESLCNSQLNLASVTEQLEELEKTNEWHYPLKGEYPKEYEDILICFLTEDDMKDYVHGWCEYDYKSDKHIFKYWNVLGTQYLETVIAWKEIVPPKGSD